MFNSGNFNYLGGTPGSRDAFRSLEGPLLCGEQSIFQLYKPLGMAILLHWELPQLFEQSMGSVRISPSIKLAICRAYQITPHIHIIAWWYKGYGAFSVVWFIRFYSIVLECCLVALEGKDWSDPNELWLAAGINFRSHWIIRLIETAIRGPC